MPRPYAARRADPVATRPRPSAAPPAGRGALRHYRRVHALSRRAPHPVLLRHLAADTGRSPARLDQPCCTRPAAAWWPNRSATIASGLSDHLVDLDCGELHPQGASRFLPKLSGGLVGLAEVLLAVEHHHGNDL